MLQVTNDPNPDCSTQQMPPPWPGHFIDLPFGQLYVRTAAAVNDAGSAGTAGSAGSAGAATQLNGALRRDDGSARASSSSASGPAGTAGSAEPALFIHGLGGSSTNWTDLMDMLSRPADSRPAGPVLACMAVDLPGFGCSPPPADGRYSISSHAEAVIDLVEQQGHRPVHLIGNSMGGAVATRVAARRPDLVRSLILISPALPDLRPRPLPLRLALAATPGIGPTVMDWLRRLPAEDRTDRTIRDLYNDPARLHPMRRSEEIAEVLRRDTLVYANNALIRSARSLVAEYFKAGRRSLWRDAAMTTAPALILHGSHDRLVNPVMAGKAARAFHSARVLILPGVGHVAMMERPTVVAAEIRSFLDWVRATQGQESSAKRL